MFVPKHDPFTVYLWADLLRASCFVMGVWVIAFGLRLFVLVRATRRWGIIGYILMAASVTGREFTRLGEPPTLWTVINFAGLLCAAVYEYKMFGHRDHLEIGDRDLDRLYPIPIEDLVWWRRWTHAIFPRKKRD
jgi:hypothetical protein